MVQAILAGRKTMTRRVMKPQPRWDRRGYGLDGVWRWRDFEWPDGGVFPASGIDDYAPYLPGDLLWVRETWRIGAWDESTQCIAVDYKADGFVRKEWLYVPDKRRFKRYVTQSQKQAEAAGLFPDTDGEYHWEPGKAPTKWRPAIFMPREAARLFLRVTGVRVEQVQEITTDDCIAEGMDCDNKINNPDPATHQSIVNWNYAYARYLFRELWDNLNAKRGLGWGVNPWVWVVTFRREEKENV
jgi:hypothetical protein